MSVTITKLDQEVPATKPSVPVVKKGGKTMKTFPKGILRTQKHSIKAVADPSKPPPLKKFMKKHTIRLITDKGLRRHKKTLKKKIQKMSNEKVKRLVQQNGLVSNPNTPPAILREMLEGGAIAGFVSLD